MTTSVEFLTDAWFAELLARGSALPEYPGADLVVQHEIEGAPSGKVRFVTEWHDGRLVRAEPGKVDAPDCVVQAKSAWARALLEGRIEPEVAWMQGVLKIDGAYRTMLVDLLPWRRSEPYRALWADMAAVTA